MINDIENIFVDNPMKIVIYDPIKQECKKIYVCVGDNIDIIKSHNADKLKKAYGKDYKDKLYPDPHSILKWTSIEPKRGGGFDKIIPYIDAKCLAAILESKNKVSVPRVSINMAIKVADIIPSQLVLIDDTDYGLIPVSGLSMLSSSDEYLDAYYITHADLRRCVIVGSDDFADDIESLLNDDTELVFNDAAQTDVKFTGDLIEYNSSVSFYPEDNFADVKNKVLLLSGIPIYRQHLFYVTLGKIHTTYDLFIDGIYSVDIRNVMSYASTNILGIPIDKYIYHNNDILKIEANDTFNILGNTMVDSTIYIVDLGLYMNPIKSQLFDMINDNYQLELLYYGFVIKFWPSITFDIFKEYITDEPSLSLKYPNYIKSRQILDNIYKLERSICDSNYSLRDEAADLIDKRTIDTAITQIIGYVQNINAVINIRNLFDLLKTNELMTTIYAYLTYNNKKYLLRKRYIRTKKEFPLSIENYMREDIIIVINANNSIIYLNILSNGTYYVKCSFAEEDGLDFTDIIEYMQKYISPIIDQINKFGSYVFLHNAQLQHINKSNLVFKSLNLCVFWKKIMTNASFKVFKSLFEPYTRANIIQANSMQQFDKYEFILIKGIYQYDPTLIEKIMSSSTNIKLQNYYEYLYNNTVKKKWEQQYKGKNIRLLHRTTDVKFEIYNILENEFTICLFYLSTFICKAIKNQSLSKTFESHEYKSVKKLKKLREEDPSLYNLKKFGSNRLYSIMCQNHRQPLIYTADELKNLPQNEINKLVKYWNFTMNKPAYYGCPSTQYPHLSFITDIHPKNYCLPCCGKKPQNVAGYKSDVNKTCLEKYTYSKTKQTSDFTKYIIGYNKPIETNRLARFPPCSLKTILSSITESSGMGYYIVGVEQTLLSLNNAGMYYSIAKILNMSIADLAQLLIDILKSDENIFDMILNNVLVEYFANVQQLIDTIIETFIDNKALHKYNFPYWNEFLAELLYLDKICVFTIIDEDGTCANPTIYVSNVIYNEIMYVKRISSVLSVELLKNYKYILLIKRKNDFFPITLVNPNDYFKVSEVVASSYTYDSRLIQLLFNMIYSSSAVVSTYIDLIALDEFCKRHNTKMIMKYINKSNLCYAVIIEYHNAHVYVPVNYSNHLPDNIPITFDAFELDNKYDLKLEALLLFIEDLNAMIKVNTTYSAIKIREFVSIGGSIVGLRTTDENIYYFKDTKHANDDTHYHVVELPFDNTKVNKAIMSRAKPSNDNRVKLIGRALYMNYQYQLFLLQCITYFNNEKNTELRAKLKDLIMSTNFDGDLTQFRESLNSMLANYTSDKSIINTQLSSFYNVYNDKNKLLDTIDKSSYGFDKITLLNLRKQPIETIKQSLMSILSNLFVVDPNFDTTKVNFPNIYTACMADPMLSYCEQNKLILTHALDQYVDLFVADILNDLKFNYMISNIWMDMTIDWLNFTKYSNEILTIYNI